MFLSHLLIDVGSNPDRPRPGRLWLRNIYHVHQRLSMGFPSGGQVVGDPDFIRPFDPAGFEKARFLFRREHPVDEESPRVVIIVQSDLEPDWGYAFRNAGMFLAAPPQTKAYNPVFARGERYSFRLRANPTWKSPTEHRRESPDPEKAKVDALGRPRTQGRRAALPWDKDADPEPVLRDWFAKKGAPDAKGARAGFELDPAAFRLLNLGWVTGYRTGHKSPRDDEDKEEVRRRRHLKFRSALLEGTLTVTDAAAFTQAVHSGIGSAKGFGFGLLSVARSL